jgi:hypothetical protein
VKFFFFLWVARFSLAQCSASQGWKVGARLLQFGEKTKFSLVSVVSQSLSRPFIVLPLPCSPTFRFGSLRFWLSSFLIFLFVRPETTCALKVAAASTAFTPLVRELDLFAEFLQTEFFKVDGIP